VTGPEDHLGLPILELFQVIRLHILELHLENARLGPFAIRPKLHVANDCLEAVRAQVVGELLLVEAVRPCIACCSTCI